MFYGMNAWFLSSLALGALWWIAFAALPGWRRAKDGPAAFRASMARGGPAIALMLLGAVALGAAASEAEPDHKWAVGAAFLALALLVSIPLSLGPGAALRALAKAEPAPKSETESAPKSEAEVETAPQVEGSPPAVDPAEAAFRLWARIHFGRCVVASTGVFFFIWAAH